MMPDVNLQISSTLSTPERFLNLGDDFDIIAAVGIKKIAHLDHILFAGRQMKPPKSTSF